MRYLGGGIGHLEQFPPANNDQDVATPEVNDEVAEEIDKGDDILSSPELVGFIGETGDDDGGEGEGDDDDDDDGDDDEDGDEDSDEDVEEDDDPEAEDNIDEETGNVY